MRFSFQNPHSQKAAFFVPFKAKTMASTMERFEKMRVDLDTHDKMVSGLNKYKAATVHGSMGDMTFSTSNLGAFA